MNLRKLSQVVVLSASLSLVACGGGAAQGHGEGHCEGECEGDCAGHTEGGEAHGAAAQGEEHGALPPTIAAFHSAIAPVWHSEAGASRAAQACTAAASLREHAGSAQSAEAPAGTDATAWSAATAALVSSTDALVATCTAQGTDVEAKLTAVHEAFHALVEQVRADR